MKFIRTGVLAAVCRRFQNPSSTRDFSAQPFSDFSNSLRTNQYSNDYERKILGSDTTPSFSFFIKKSDNGGKAQGSSAFGGMSGFMQGTDESCDTLADGLNYKLKKAATYFEFDPNEVTQEDFSFRTDVNFSPGQTYDTKDLDLQNKGIFKQFRRLEFETTTAEVLQKADFRNVRFLANFITEAGILTKRNKFKISAKAQRKIAREIKTARAFGLMPFTTMGTKAFVFGNTMQELDTDFEYENQDYNFVDNDD